MEGDRERQRLPCIIWCLQRGSGDGMTPLSTKANGGLVNIRSIQIQYLHGEDAGVRQLADADH